MGKETQNNKKSKIRIFIENYKKNWDNYVSREIAIEYKACLYFYCILVFHCIYLACKGQFQVSVLHMCEMIIATYLMGYVQIYLLGNFDEADSFGKREFGATVLCTAMYTIVSFLGNWFGRSILATALFFMFFLFSYWCVYLINKIKRNIDTGNLNEMLIQFKEGEMEYATDSD